MKKKEYIYCENDVEQAIKEAIEDTFKWNYDLVEFFNERVARNLREYANLYRFYDRNCAGCVGSNDECDFAYGRGEAKGAWEKVKKGEMFNCPVRINGSFNFNTAEPEKGLQKIDISDRKEKPYPIINPNQSNQ